MKYAIIIARILLGLMFAVFGSNAFLHFIPMPPLQGQAGEFMEHSSTAATFILSQRLRSLGVCF